MKLNLGCGVKRIREGYLNVDINPDINPDKVMDIRKVPWEWKDNSIEEIILENVLEQFTGSEIRDIIRECYRVLEVEGVVKIWVYTGIYGDVFNQKSLWSDRTPKIISAKSNEEPLWKKGYYTGEWEVIKQKSKKDSEESTALYFELKKVK